MNDLISRQAAKLTVARVTWEAGDSFSVFHDKCVDCLDDVPPAKPDLPDTNVGDMISRQVAIRWVKTECNPYGKPTLDFESGKKVIELLKKMPSIQPEIIACGQGELVQDGLRLVQDLISRQGAIDEIINLWADKPFGNPALVEIKDCIEKLPSAQPEPMWILVEERLPEPNEREDDVQKYYLIQNEFGDMMVAAYLRNTSGYTWWEQMYTYKPVEDKVIAWMPLPKRYERSE